MNPMPMSKELVAASSRPMVLSILSGGESYGYEILQQVTALSRGQVAWSEGMLYPVLHRLERERLVTSRWETAASGRRRKYYRLTGSGGKRLEHDRSSWLAVHRALTQAWAVNNV